MAVTKWEGAMEEVIEARGRSAASRSPMVARGPFIPLPALLRLPLLRPLLTRGLFPLPRSKAAPVVDATVVAATAAFTPNISPTVGLEQGRSERRMESTGGSWTSTSEEGEVEAGWFVRGC